MRKIIFLMAAVWLFAAGSAFALSNQDDDEQPREFTVKGVAGGVSGTVEDKASTSDAVIKEKIIATGALEKVEGSKYTLRKVQTRLEFYLPDDVKIYLKSDGSTANLNEKCYLDIRGPKNKKAVLANAIYIYGNKKMFDEMTDKDALPAKKSFQAPLTGVVTQKNPIVGRNENGDVIQKYSFIIRGDDGIEYQVCFDDDTLWVYNTTATKAEMLPGDRMKLYFTKMLSIRYNNYPFKIIIDKSKNVF